MRARNWNATGEA